MLKGVDDPLVQPCQNHAKNAILNIDFESPAILDISLPLAVQIHSNPSSRMASSSQRVVHQDYIARIRYSNALPPPPNPPKLLDIPNTGLASGQYTTPGFASRLSRDQPLNIEADAELGMPLDLVGMPGIFDGDESCK